MDLILKYLTELEAGELTVDECYNMINKQLEKRGCNICKIVKDADNEARLVEAARAFLEKIDE